MKNANATVKRTETIFLKELKHCSLVRKKSLLKFFSFASNTEKLEIQTETATRGVL